MRFGLRSWMGRGTGVQATGCDGVGVDDVTYKSGLGNFSF